MPKFRNPKTSKYLKLISISKEEAQRRLNSGRLLFQPNESWVLAPVEFTEMLALYHICDKLFPKEVHINLLAGWCEVCEAEIPAFFKLAQKLQ